MRRILAIILLGALLIGGFSPVQAQGVDAVIRVLDRAGAEITELVDGNSLRLSLKLSAPEAAQAEALFSLSGLSAPVASCTLAAGSDTCTSQAFASLGWFYSPDGQPDPEQTLRVTVGGREMPGALTIRIHPRPIVMVHGFLSNWETWKAYLGPQGYLASIGLQGFAVGDGQAPGVLNTGSPSSPESRTNSIAQNAEIIGQYIEAVQKQTGAEKVDLLAHSMGGMISRYYLDRVMKTENVGQVIFLGTPMAGSACVYPVAALGFLLPASLEILPDYMVNVFNQQIIHRHGVPFHMVAGTLLIDPLTSPCTDAPSDTVVGLGSATSITLDDVQELPMYHGNLTSDQRVFDEDVRHLLQLPPGSFAHRPDLVAPAVTSRTEQFSQTFHGHLQPGESAQVTINIEPNVSLATFSMYDSSRSLEVEVRGASGKVIELDVAKNGLMKISDPATMLYLGYGFKQPKPGKWVVMVKTSAETPARGADYAINARFVGGAALSASSSVTIPAIGQPVTINASLQLEGASLTVESATALIRKPDGALESLPLSAHGDLYSAEYLPQQSGLHSVEVVLSGKNADGFGIDRAAFLAFEVQPGRADLLNVRQLVLMVCGVGLVLLIGGLVALFVRLRRRKKI